MFLQKIEILNNKTLQVRFLKDDNSYHREIYTPDMDINKIEYEEIKQKAQELWTDEVVQEYKDSLIADNLEVLNE